ncbi:MAG: hypothetical protein P8X96_00965 [Desulfobacteraceae bacterium]
MSDGFYAVELFYDPENEATADRIRSFLERFGYLNPTRTEKMISSGKIVLKRNVDYVQAVDIQQRIRINGTACKIKKQPYHRSDPQAPTKGIATQNSAQIANTADEMVCPKCNTRQPHVSECLRCGIIISKIHKPVGSEDQNSKPALARKCSSIPKKSNPKKVKSKKYQPVLKAMWEKYAYFRRQFAQRSQKPFNAAIECVVLVISAYVLELASLFLARYLWYILSHTSVGKFYQEFNTGHTAVIEKILSIEATDLFFNVILLVLLANLILGLVAQLTHICRWYLDTSGFIIKALWILLSTLGTAWIISKGPLTPSLFLAFMLTLLPTVCLLECCLKLARTIIPEIGTAVSKIKIMVGSGKSFCDGLKSAKRKIH